MPDTPMLGLPLIAASQAQKHITHNEALMLLDAMVQLSVISRTMASPPASAVDGDRYLLPASPSGAWAGQAGKLAVLQGGGWVFLAPRPGWCMWVEAEARLLTFDGGAWREPVSLPDATNAPRMGVNATADEVNRLAVAGHASLFTHAGDGHQMKLNKNAAGDTASLLYQTNWSGRAEMGLAGNDDFAVKVSADGTAWKEALVIERHTGAVCLPNTPLLSRKLFSQSLATQGPGFASDTYLMGSAITLPPSGVKPGTRYSLVFDVNKYATATTAPLIRLRFGQTGSLADPVLGQVVFGAQTPSADDGRFTVDVMFRSVGPGTAAQVQAVFALQHNLATGGLSVGAGPVRRVGSAGFDSTLPGAMIGLSINAGASSSWMVTLVQASLENFD